jgi:PII-like signaling protein
MGDCWAVCVGGTITTLVWLGLAGAACALARYALSGLVHRVTDAGFPWGTPVVNVVGCGVAGLTWSATEARLRPGSDLRVIILVGLAGATVLRGVLGNGRSSRVHAAKVLRLAEDLPLVVEIVDSAERIDAFLPVLSELVGGGLVTFEKVTALARTPRATDGD